MISLDELRQQPPAGLNELDAYAAGDLPRTEELGEALSLRVRLSGLEAAQVSTLVCVGSSGGNVLEAAARLLPALQQVLVLEPDARMLRTVQTRELAAPVEQGPQKYHFADVVGSTEIYSLPGYFELCNFLAACGAAPSRVVCHAAAPADPGLAATHAALERAVQDACRGFSADFLTLCEHSGEWPTDFCRQWSALLFEQGEAYHCLRFLLALSRPSPSPTVARQILDCWTQLQCPAALAEWLPAADLEAGARTQVERDAAALMSQQAAVARETRQRNLALLKRRFGATVERLSQLPESELLVVTLPDVPWSLHRRSEGPVVQRKPYHLLLRRDGPYLRELNPPPDPALVEQAIARANSARFAHVCVGSILRYPNVANAINNRITCPMPNWKQVVYLLEPDLEALHVLLGLINITTLLDDDRIHLFTGADPVRELVEFFQAIPNRIIPRIQLDIPASLNQVLNQVEKNHVAQAQLIADELEAAYDASAPGRLLDVLAGRERRKPRLLLLTSIHTTVLQYVTQDLARGFEQAGCEVHVLMEQSALDTLQHVCIAGQLRDFQPDLLFLIDHVRPEASRLIPSRLPLVCWILDELPRLRKPSIIEQLGSLDFTFALNTSVTNHYRDLGYPHIACAPFAVDPDKFKLRDPGEPRDEVAYITNLYYPADSAFAPGVFPELRRRLERTEVVPLAMSWIRPILDAVIADVGAEIPPARYESVVHEALLAARHVDRVRVAGALLDAGIPLALYGRGWDEIPRFRPFARGFVEPGEPLARAYCEHKVVLHINRHCNMHARVFEAIAAGGFLVARSDGDFDYTPGEIAENLAIGKEVTLFSDHQELVQIVRRAFVDEAWRQGVIRAGRERIRKHHTYACRARLMLEELRRALAERVKPQAA